MGFTKDMLDKAEPYLEAQTKSPFMQEMIAGTLDQQRLVYWVKVDYPYLINFSRILALGVLRAPDFDSMRTVQRYLNYIVDEEMESHGRFAASVGITQAELEAQRMGPTKHSYAQHEFASASKGELAEILTAITPCLVGWQILSKRILKDHQISDDNPYAWWFRTYGSDAGLDGHVVALLELLDRLVEGCSPARRENLERIFLTSEYFETVAWKAYYTMEQWPTPAEIEASYR
ncbi:MAG: thiaminase II [Actinomycetales bacterium]|nr:thiaminase II [Actinomycetales bacterium]